MPFVSNTHQWHAAGSDEKKKQDCANLLMRKTGIQLHQGSHTFENFGEEEEGLETKSYLGAVNELLDRIHRASLNHVARPCAVCNKGDTKPNVRPVESIVRQMDQASLILKLKIKANQIFVSERAYKWFKAGRA